MAVGSISLRDIKPIFDEIFFWIGDTETSSIDPNQAELLGISISTQIGHACYIPVGHIASEQNTENDKNNFKGQLSQNYVIDKLRPILEDPSILKIGQNIKFDYKILLKYSVSLCSFEDTMLMSYSLNAGLHRHNLDTLSEMFLSHNPIKIESLINFESTDLLDEQVRSVLGYGKNDEYVIYLD